MTLPWRFTCCCTLAIATLSIVEKDLSSKSAFRGITSKFDSFSKGSESFLLLLMCIPSSDVYLVVGNLCGGYFCFGFKAFVLVLLVA